jgi:hypothetical protein
MAKELIYLFTAILLLFSCQTDTDKKTIADQKKTIDSLQKTIDSLQLEFNDYKWYCEQWISKWK